MQTKTEKKTAKVILCASALLLLIMLLGCVSDKPSEDMKNEMKDPILTKDREYGELSLEWEVPEGECVSEIAVLSAEGEELYVYRTYQTFENIKDILAHACQENGYSGPVSFVVRVKEERSGKVCMEWKSEEIESSEWFPAEETIDVSGMKLKEFHWHREMQTYFVEELCDVLSSFDVYMSDDPHFLAVYYDEAGNEEQIDKRLNEEELNGFLDLIRDGKLVRKEISDPELEILDGPIPEDMRAIYEETEESFADSYEFRLNKEKKENLLSAVYAFCKNGKWPE